MIYVLEDDDSIRNLMLYTLRAAGFESEGYPDSGPFWEAMRREKPSLVLLDIMLPGEDGIAVLKKLRADPNTEAVPVIMATAKGAEYDRILGLDLGADDYLSKPFGMLEMVSRVRAVLRRVERYTHAASNPAPGQPEQPPLTAGDLQMDLTRHLVTVQGQRITLTLKEFELLRTFLQSPGRVFTRDELLNAIWDTDFLGETRTVDVHIRTLRAKLGPCGDYIQTVRGVGYLLEASSS